MNTFMIDNDFTRIPFRKEKEYKKGEAGIAEEIYISDLYHCTYTVSSWKLQKESCIIDSPDTDHGKGNTYIQGS